MQHHPIRNLVFSGLVGCLVFTEAASAVAAPPGGRQDPASVTARIDRHIQTTLTEHKVQTAPFADDAEFLRRAYLDIVGLIPPPDKAAEFLDSKAPDKRRKLIDELLEHPAYGHHFATIWANLFKRQTIDKYQIFEDDALEGLRFWLAAGFNGNRSWAAMVHDMLTTTTDVKKPQPRPEMAFFVTSSDISFDGTLLKFQPRYVAGSIGRLFMGVQMHCAECHDSFLNDELKQTDFWGIAAFFSRTQLAAVELANRQGTPVVSESADMRSLGSIRIPETSFKNIGLTVKARFPGSAAPPALGGGKSERAEFGGWLTSPDNPYFARTIVNRLWADFFGLGFVNPLDDFNGENLPSHPELLKLLAAEFAGSGFDQKHLIRCICNSQAYQRTSRGDANPTGGKPLFARMNLKPMSPDLLLLAVLLALDLPELPLPPRPGKRPVNDPTAGAAAQAREFLKFFSTKEQNAAATEFSHGVPQALRLMNRYFTANAVNRFWAHFFARGLVEPLDDINPMNIPSHAGVLQLLSRELIAANFDIKHLIRCICNTQAYQRTSRRSPGNEKDRAQYSRMPVKFMSAEMMFDSLQIAVGKDVSQSSGGKGGTIGRSRSEFSAQFGTADLGEETREFTQGIPQFLSLLNDRDLNRGGPLIENAVKAGSREQGIELLYLAALSRRPTAVEIKRINNYLSQQPDVRKGFTGLLVVLLNSAEFMFNR